MIGKTISHYQILEKLGEGEMGVVYKARDTRLDRFIALKIPPAEKVADPDRRRRFVQEAKAAASLNHPHIVTIYDIDPEEFSLWSIPSGGEKQQFIDLVTNRGVQIAEDGIYFMRPEKQASDVSLQYLNTTTSKTERIASFSKPNGGLSVSPDRRWIVYGQLDQSGSALMLVENFK